MLDLENVHFSYSKKKILNGITFSLFEGEISALIGVSGSGKTTLFRLITQLIEPQEGRIFIQSKDGAKNKILTTFMRQEDLLLPWRNVIDNLLLFTELGERKSRNLYLEKAYFLLDQVGLKGFELYFPEQLSGGMRQRVSFARALLQDRPLLLLDEPFGSLDIIIREELYTLLRKMCKKMNKTVLFVTHDFRDALALADRILVLHQGTIVDAFSLQPEIRDCPQKCEEIKNSIRLKLI